MKQNRSVLRGDPEEEDKVLTEAIQINGEKAIRVALARARARAARGKE